MFTENDLKQFVRKGISNELIASQLDHFIRGFPFIRLVRPATLGDGIFAFSETEKEHFAGYFSRHSGDLSIIKFVPASGAASRMFKHLFEFRESFDGSDKSKQTYHSDTGFNSVSFFIGHLPDIAFYASLQRVAEKQGVSIPALIANWELSRVIKLVLDEEGLNYSDLPKGLLEFHDYPGGARTSAEEHLVEAAAYARNNDGSSRIHFTISPEHQEKFDALFSRIREAYEKRWNTRFDIGFSRQSPATDTIAVDEQNKPFRQDDGSILFRPGGHGALLSNLQALNADIVFIKNIDNVVPDRLKEPTIIYKKVIGGYLLFIKDRIHDFLERSEENLLSKEDLTAMVIWMKDHLFVSFPENYMQQHERVIQHDLRERLNRPIRVCGMVKNEGEPGGGPFWVLGSDGKESLQIVESSQIDPMDPMQQDIVSKSTHFNPVDLVCSVRDYTGRPFDLSLFSDPETGFIARKSAGGITLKAQELPGLWNGAMAGWITVFAEVPIITFNPVKTVNDLLRKEHLRGNP